MGSQPRSCNEFDIKNAPERSCVAFDLGVHPYLSKFEHLLFSVSRTKNRVLWLCTCGRYGNTTAGVKHRILSARARFMLHSLRQ